MTEHDRADKPASRRRLVRVAAALTAAVSIVAATIAWQLDLGDTAVGEANADYRFVVSPRPGWSPDSHVAVVELATHPLLQPDLALTRVDCTLPAFTGTLAEWRAYHTAAVACFDAVWAPALAARGLAHSTPLLSFDSVPGSSPCGVPSLADDATAWYCALDTTIYLPVEQLVDDLAGHGEAGHLAVVAHEYGHHLQETSGLLLAADLEQRRHMRTSAEALAVSRRVELQANCFAGLSLAAVLDLGRDAEELAHDALDVFVGYDDSDTHGSRRSRGEWMRQGYLHTTTDASDTWSAEAAAVG